MRRRCKFRKVCDLNMDLHEYDVSRVLIECVTNIPVEFYKMELLGCRVLCTESRVTINHPTLRVLHLRHGDNGDPCSIENWVGVNHHSSIVVSYEDYYKLLHHKRNTSKDSICINIRPRDYNFLDGRIIAF